MEGIPPMITLHNFLLRDFNSNIKLVLLTGTTLIVFLLTTYDLLTLLFKVLSIAFLTSSALSWILNY